MIIQRLTKEFVDDLVSLIEYKINVKVALAKGEINYLIDYEDIFRKKYQKGVK